MVSTLIGLIFVVIMLGVFWWAAKKLIPLIPLAEPFRTILYVLMVILMVFVVLWFFSQLLGMAGIKVPIF